MKHRKKKRFPLLLLIVILLIAFFSIKTIVRESPLNIPGIFNIHHTADVSNGWNLILINKENYIPKNYEVEFTTLSNGEQVDKRIYPDLQAMFDDARAAGLQLFVRAGYRTGEEQQRLLDDKIEAYRNEGHSKFEAQRLAKEWVAVPGTSEHQIGIAVDINADTSVCSGDEVYLWLAENAYRYGFIYRYPSDKKDITGVMNEPWHYRYVGKESAEEMYFSGLCLEEYIQQRIIAH